MTECTGCGRCCYPVTLAWSQREVAMMPPGTMDPVSRNWILHDLVPISRREGLAMRPDLKGKQTIAVESFGPNGTNWSMQRSQFFLCRHFDAERRRCNNYEGRCSICRGYPYLEASPPKDARPCLPPECSYNADYNLPVAEWEPVPLLRAPPEEWQPKRTQNPA